MDQIWLPVVLFLVAAFYSSVGFGGGSSYLAILSLVLLDFFEIRSVALTLNLVVVSLGTLLFIRSKTFDWKLFWPFVVLSVPMAFLSSQLRLSQTYFFIILGLSLILAGISMTLQAFLKKGKTRNFNRFHSLLVGGGIGFLSGLVGIGGGIFLSPTLNLAGWKDSRTIASLASFFILINSFTGLFGLAISDSLHFNFDLLWKLVLAVLLGGILGSYLTNSKLNIKVIRILTAILVTYVGVRLIVMNVIA